MFQAAIYMVVTVCFAMAGLTQIFGAGHWVAAFSALGVEPWARYLTGLVQLVAAGLFWWPGRRGYGAALMLVVACAAVLAHLAVLGISSAPPAVVLALLSGRVLRQNQRDFQR